MPFIEVKFAGELNQEQKAEIAKEFTGVVERVAGIPSAVTQIVFTKVEWENWSVAGKLLEKH